VDKALIRQLYRASQAGVEIDLLVRGTCCLRPGVPGVSDRIRVRSVVGRFLEHSRIFFFQNGQRPEVFLGSADLMPRNLDHRVEVLFPVDRRQWVSELRDVVLAAYLADNVNAYALEPDGTYRQLVAGPGELETDSQSFFVQLHSHARHATIEEATEES
jgi:polyphosphate kinase